MYYFDGEEIAIGDVVFWNEGMCLGAVSGIFETSDELEGVSQCEPGIMLSFSVSIMNPLPGGMFVECADFKDDGINKCSQKLLIRLFETHAKIARVVDFSQYTSDSYGINRIYMPVCKKAVWVYIYYASISSVRALLLVNEDLTKASILSELQFIKLKEAASIVDLDLKWVAIDK